MGFQNPITGGQGTLERNQIKSFNYVPGSSGWIIMRNGNAEFNNVTVRGSVEIIGVGDAILFYSPSAGAGNLVASFAAVGGTDSFGNTYPAGMSIRTASNQAGVLAGYRGSGGVLTFPGFVPNVSVDGGLFFFSQGAGTAQQAQVSFFSPEDATQNDVMALSMIGSSRDGTQNPHAAFTYNAPDGTFQGYLNIGLSGMQGTGYVQAVKPGSGTARNNYAVPEGWNTLALNAHYTAPPAPFVSLRYRKEGIGSNGKVALSGAVQIATAAAAFDIIGTLPSAYQPPSGKHFAVGYKTAAGALTTFPLNVTNAGQIEIGAATALNDVMSFDGVSFELDP